MRTFASYGFSLPEVLNSVEIEDMRIYALEGSTSHYT